MTSSAKPCAVQPDRGRVKALDFRHLTGPGSREPGLFLARAPAQHCGCPVIGSWEESEQMAVERFTRERIIHFVRVIGIAALLGIVVGIVSSAVIGVGVQYLGPLEGYRLGALVGALIGGVYGGASGLGIRGRMLVIGAETGAVVGAIAGSIPGGPAMPKGAA